MKHRTMVIPPLEDGLFVCLLIFEYLYISRVTRHFGDRIFRLWEAFRYYALSGLAAQSLSFYIGRPVNPRVTDRSSRKLYSHVFVFVLEVELEYMCRACLGFVWDICCGWFGHAWRMIGYRSVDLFGICDVCSAMTGGSAVYVWGWFRNVRGVFGMCAECLK